MSFLTLSLLPLSRGLAPRLHLHPEAGEVAAVLSADLHYLYGHNTQFTIDFFPTPYMLYEVLEGRLSASSLLRTLCTSNSKQTAPCH